MSDIVKTLAGFIDKLKKQRGKIKLKQRSNTSTSNDEKYLSKLIELIELAVTDKTHEFDVKTKDLKAILRECLPVEDTKSTTYIINTITPYINKCIHDRDQLIPPLLDIIKYCKTIPNFPLFCVLEATDSRVFGILNYVFLQTNETLALFLYKTKYEDIINTIVAADVLSIHSLRAHMVANQKLAEHDFIDFLKATESTRPQRFSEAGDFSKLITPELQDRYERMSKYGRTPLSAPTSPINRPPVHVTPRLVKSTPNTPKTFEEAGSINMLSSIETDFLGSTTAAKVTKKKPTQPKQSVPILPLHKLQQDHAKQEAKELSGLRVGFAKLDIDDDGAVEENTPNRNVKKHKKKHVKL